jgi:hypothetical protein
LQRGKNSLTKFTGNDTYLQRESDIQGDDLTIFNLAEQLRYCFGIISPNAAESSEVILSFVQELLSYGKP